MRTKRVVITGLGCVTPLGHTIAENWQNLRQGKSGIAPVNSFDASGLPVKIAGEIKNFDSTKWLQNKQLRRLDTFIVYGMVAAEQALRQSGAEREVFPWLESLDRTRFGVCAGSGIGGIETIENNIVRYHSAGKVSPFFVPGSIINMLPGMISMHYGLKGPNIAPASACTSGAHAIALACRLIACGDADIMLAGGAEKACTPVGISAFAAARALSSKNEDPVRASRPWDRDRDGFVIADGAGMLILEALDHAISRNARIIAEVIGSGFNSDAHHLTAPPESGEGAAGCIQHALKNASIAPEQIGYINAHGTSTSIGDLVEIRAIRSVFGAHAKKLAISSTKSMSGHMIGAAGAAEAIFTCLSLEHQMVPPTINLDHPDDECSDLNLVAHRTQPLSFDIAISNSFGFGGANGTIVLRRWLS